MFEYEIPLELHAERILDRWNSEYSARPPDRDSQLRSPFAYSQAPRGRDHAWIRPGGGGPGNALLFRRYGISSQEWFFQAADSDEQPDKPPAFSVRDCGRSGGALLVLLGENARRGAPGGGF